MFLVFYLSLELNEFSVKGRRLCPLEMTPISTRIRISTSEDVLTFAPKHCAPCYCCLKHVFFLSRGMHHFCLETEGHAVIVESDKLGLHFFGTPAITTNAWQKCPTFYFSNSNYHAWDLLFFNRKKLQMYIHTAPSWESCLACKISSTISTRLLLLSPSVAALLGIADSLFINTDSVFVCRVF